MYIKVQGQDFLTNILIKLPNLLMQQSIKSKTNAMRDYPIKSGNDVWGWLLTRGVG